jgi:hypothetical protein
MPRYVLPKPSKKQDENTLGAMPVEDSSWRRRINVPANKAITDSLKTDEIVRITLVGRVKSIESRSSTEGGDSGSVELDTDSVEVYPSVEGMDQRQYESARESGEYS